VHALKDANTLFVCAYVFI